MPQGKEPGVLTATSPLLDAHSFLIFVRFSIDAILTGASAWMIVVSSKQLGRGLLEIILAWMWIAVALVAGAGVVLAETGGLSANGFFLFHFLIFSALGIWRQKLLGTDWRALTETIRRLFDLLNWRTGEGVFGTVSLAILACLATLAALAKPVVYDALAYHLPRIAAWLQDGRIEMLTVQDERLNFVTGLPDLVMAWFLTATTVGFQLINLTQVIGGLMAFAATAGLARETGLRRCPSILAAMLLFGMANVVVQFTATQTDLFTTGVLASAFYLWMCAQRRGTSSVIGGLGAGLALAAKGTLFYLAPGLIIWVIWWGWIHRIAWEKWRATLLAAIAGIIFFAGPGFLRNWRAYGSALGPHEWVGKLHHAADSPEDFFRKLKWNLQSTLAQNFEPNSQPRVFRDISQALGVALAQGLPERDKFSLDNQNRRSVLEKTVLSRSEPDADATSFGTVSLLLFMLAATIACVQWRRNDSRLVLVWSAGLTVSLLFFEAMQQWHPFAFRYFVLAGPWIAVCAAWGIEQLGRLRRFFWTLAILGTATVGWNVTTHTHSAGWRAVVQPERSLGYFVASNWRDWSQSLDSTDAPLSIALPDERPLAAFYRQSPLRVVHLKPEPASTVTTAEKFIGNTPGWNVVAATRFLGREGNVRASVWLNHGNEADPYSVAAYRRLRPGEKAEPVVYRQQRRWSAGSVSDDILVKTWDSAAVRFSLSNPSNQDSHYQITTPTGINSGILRAKENIVASVSLQPNAVCEIIFSFTQDPGPSSTDAPRVEILSDPPSR